MWRQDRTTLGALSAATKDILINGGRQARLSLRSQGFAGTVKIRRRIMNGDTPTYEDITDESGDDFSWTGDATVTVDVPGASHVSAYVSAYTSGSIVAEIQAGNRR